MSREKILNLSGRIAVGLIVALLAIVVVLIWSSPTAVATRILGHLLETTGTCLMAAIMIYLYTRDMILSEKNRTLGCVAYASYNVTVVSIIVCSLATLPLFWKVFVDEPLLWKSIGTSFSMLVAS
ncbi:MAG: hypothetical protein OSB47_08570, partial [Pirellulaceae bacterium]|nr:hypothetical protein [Pirellulaceae bacterium]